MKSTVDELVMWLNPSSPDVVRRHIAKLDSIDSRFSGVALRLFTESTSESTERYVRIMINKWIITSSNFDGALARVNHYKENFGAHYNAARLVLDDAISAYCVTTMVIPKEYEEYSMIQAASTGDFHLASMNIMARPDMLSASSKELADYYRPIAVAGTLLGVNIDEQRFMDEAPAFLAWVAEQDNVDEIVSAALQTKSLDPSTIEAMAGMKQATPSSLHSGLI